MRARALPIFGLVVLLLPTTAMGEGSYRADVIEGAQRALQQARELTASGRMEEAVAVLEKEVERTGFLHVAEALWLLHYQLGQAEEAQRLVARLLARQQEPPALRSGRVLAARAAVLGGDLAAAERHYRAYLALPDPQPDIAAELLAIAAPGEADGDRRAALTDEICRTTPLGTGDINQCAADLLHLAGDHRRAYAAMTKYAVRWPNNASVLSQLAILAEAAEDWETAEWARRRIIVIETDPLLLLLEGWEGLARQYAARDKLSELEALAAEARSTLRKLPPRIAMTLADVLIRHGQARRAIDVLREARAELPPGEDPIWIDDKLRTAYEAFAKEQP